MTNKEFLEKMRQKNPGVEVDMLRLRQYARNGNTENFEARLWKLLRIAESIGIDQGWIDRIKMGK